MAVTPTHDPRRPSLMWTRLHFLVRLLGLLGIQAAVAGLILIQVEGARPLDPGQDEPTLSAIQRTLMGRYLLIGGGIAALFALVVEGLVVVRFVAGRRSALGANALVQVVLAIGLVVLVNTWSFHQHARLDWTRQGMFTLPGSVRAQLAQLDPKSETSIILYQRHRSSSTSDKPDPYDLEAERKVVEKVKDLVDLFREVGPQFRVEVLDVAARGFDEKLKQLTRDAPELKKAIDEAPDNSILIHAGKSVQRLSFNEFYRLDRTASEKKGHENLVLRSVGPEPITRRVVNVEERKPRIGILTVHEALSSEGPVNLFTLAGARKALLAHGFDVRDVVLRTPTGEPAADVLAVSKMERLQDDLDDLGTEIRSLEREIRLLEMLVKETPRGDGAKLNRLIVDYAEQFNPRFILLRASDSNRDTLARLFGNQLAASKESLELAREERTTVSGELAGLSGDKVSEQRRSKDLRAKLAHNVADVDLILVPRLTIAQSGDPIANPAFHDLDARHALTIKEFLRAGKPLLACLGPTNMPNIPGRPGAQPTKQHDELERMLAELGIVAGKRTVLFNVEKRAFAGRDENLLRASKPLMVPPLRLEPAARTLGEELQQIAFAPVREAVAALGTAVGNPLGALAFVRLAEPVLPPNPVQESLRLADLESGRRLELRLRFLRPMFIDPLRGHLFTYQPEVLSTSAASWHDEQPFSTPVRPVPRFEPPALDDPDNGTLEARRRGPFTVGVAVETRLPASWAADERTASKVRVAAVGQAGMFTGQDLPAGQERLLVDLCNWLLGREEQLARQAPEWSYPRVEMGYDARSLWLWGARLGLPEVFAFLGLVVMLLRRLR